jgi:hypothetical protein
MFGKNKEEQKEENPECQYDAKYVGGHPAFPKSHDTKVLIFKDRLELEKLEVEIPYKTIKSIENMDEKKMKALRIVVLGVIFLPLAIVGALWKKKYRYTVIQTHDTDNNMDVTIILDFHRKIEEAQALIYDKVVESKTTTTTPTLIQKESVGGRSTNDKK